jgi:hypothetical protein
MTEVLSQRGLNRATLARQHLLERTAAPAIDAIGHLGGMQSQAPLAPYVGLWTRLKDFAPDELSALTDQRQVVRLHLMRNTVHLVRALDCLDWRALFYPLHAAEFSAHFRRGMEGVDRDALLRQAKRLLEEQPRTRGEAGQALYDLPDAPRPSEDMPAPPRFLPEYDNLLLSHKDRTRVIPGNRPVPLPPGNGATAGTFLVDGMWQGTWQIRDQSLRIQPFTKLRRADRDALLTEAGRSCAFVATEAKHDIILENP